MGFGLLAGCADTGAHLTLSAPDGPGAVTSFKVVLATPEHVPSVGGQRTAPALVETQTVSYYLQRTIAGGTHGKIDAVDGFAIRVEPDPAMTETQFIPFVLMYEGEQIVAVATFYAPGGAMPSPILVLRDEIDKYVLDVEPVVQVGDLDPVATGNVRVVECTREDQSTFTSGIVWRPRGGGEMRLLFPNDGGLDATERELDLDCDLHPVTVESSNKDCDDTRDWFHRDIQDTCDGYDTNCDGLQSLVVACTGANVCTDSNTTTGIALCNDRTGEQSRCESDPQCACAAGTSACSRCMLSNELGTSTGMLKACQPSIGFIHLEGCEDAAQCRVDVASVGGGWKAEVSPDVQPYTFGLSAQIGYKLVLRVRRPEGPVVEIPGIRGTSTGDIVLAVQTANLTYLRAIDLQFETDGATCQGTGPFPMTCY
ncbi:MAG TPA: putative metal-binding motif-containing protein [Kofleriaceae bacterium]